MWKQHDGRRLPEIENRWVVILLLPREFGISRKGQAVGLGVSQVGEGYEQCNPVKTFHDFGQRCIGFGGLGGLDQTDLPYLRR